MQTDEPETSEKKHLNPHLWVDLYADYLYAFAITRLHDENLVRDLLQETFLAALERKDNFEGRSTEKTWLTAILKNKIIDVYRAKSSGLKKNILTEQDDADFFDSKNGHWNDEYRPILFGIEQPNALENKEFQKILQACMKKLPSLWFAVFTLKHIDDESTQTICKELQVTTSNFGVIMHRTKVSLRSCLQKNWI
ncbi:sigma-70 family RNA polymerase sigma factor [Pedobacter sp. UC225_61]|uniref:sigma-70 family RNA polymerase sigma factor n=1 Tax=Pedobacter sp. UC225_61 TaxID=3374623 RepID=UPI003791794C